MTDDSSLNTTNNESFSRLSEAEIQNLFSRLIQFVFPKRMYGEERQFLFKQLPEEWLPEIHLPEGSSCIASMIISQGMFSLVETNLSSNEVLQFFQKQMQSLGWNVLNRTLDYRSFIPVPTTNRIVFCRSTRGPSLEVEVKSIENETEIYLILLKEGRNSICATKESLRASLPQVLPELVNPPNAHFIRGV